MGDNKTLSTSETLHLENLTREDDGTEYKCLVVNSMGSAEASAVVSIHCKYMFFFNYTANKHKHNYFLILQTVQSNS